MKKIQASFTGLLQFVLLSALSTFTFIILLILQLDFPDKLAGWFYIATIPSYYYLILLIVTLVLSPLYYIPYLRYLILLPKIAFDVFFIVDIFVFNLYRFHVDMLFVEMVVFDFKGMGFSGFILGVSALTLFAIIVFNAVIFRMTLTKRRFKTSKLNGLLLTLFIMGQFFHIWAYEYKQTFIIKYTPLLPYYLPATSHGTMVKIQQNYPQWIPEPIEKPSTGLANLLDATSSSDKLFSYPAKPLLCAAPPEQQLNVLMFVVESWQARMMNEAVTPNIYRYSNENYRFENHYSGGSVTVSGLFSLMYGLHPNYLPIAQSAPNKYQTLLTKTLDEQGYEIKAYTSSNFDRFNMKQMFFGNIAAENYINPQINPVVSDQSLVNSLVKDLGKPTDKPWYKFAFVTSSHHNYDYPASAKVFNPVKENSEAYLFDKNVDAAPYLNDYKNSLYYVDSLFAQVNKALVQSGQADNTIVIITGDHGEEFNENKQGYWGHGSNFTKYQAAVPLVVALPKSSGGVIRERSGHVDIAPTLLQEAIGCSNPVTDFSSGQNLFALPSDRGLEIRSYKNKAYLFGDRIYTADFAIESYDVNDITKKYEDIEYNKINEIRKEMSRFLD